MSTRCSLASLFVLATATLAPAQASADFQLCNNSSSRIGVAVGYNDPGSGWMTEGWWNLHARTCQTLLKGPLVARRYYLHAVNYDRGGEWSGKTFMCTHDKEFTIRGAGDCVARGFERTGFFAVDTVRRRRGGTTDDFRAIVVDRP